MVMKDTGKTSSLAWRAVSEVAKPSDSLSRELEEEDRSAALKKSISELMASWLL
jgi:hypothetical protein